MKLNTFFTTGLIGNVFAVMAGALLTLAFAPFSLWPLAIISPALLLGLWLNVSPKYAFWRGWLYGLGFFGTGVYWVFISIHTYGNTSILLAGFITAMFVSLLAFFPALNGFLLQRYFPHNQLIKYIAAFSAIWVLLEWLRSFIFTGFPWLLIGTTQVHSPLKGFAPIVSVYGVSLAVIVTSGLLVGAIISAKQKQTKSLIVCACLFLALWVAGFALSFIQWTKSKGPPIQVSLVQGNIEQSLKWSLDQIIPTMLRYQQLTDANWNSKIIVWPENAIPLPLQDAENFIETMSDAAKAHDATLITGIPAKHWEKDTYYNAVVAFGKDQGFYLKQRLVPFGEYTPLPHLLTRIMEKFAIPMSNMIPAEKDPQPLLVHGIKIATFICYEIAFPFLVLKNNNDVDLLLTVSNDAWFGYSIAQAQHLQMAEMRALEMGRPILFVSNTGITAFINPDGSIQSAAPPYQEYVLTDMVQPMNGKTFWQEHGSDPLFLGLATLIFYSLRSQKKQSKQAS